MKCAWMAVLCLGLLSGCGDMAQTQKWSWTQWAQKKSDTDVIRPIEEGPVPAATTAPAEPPAATASDNKPASITPAATAAPVAVPVMAADVPAASQPVAPVASVPASEPADPYSGYHLNGKPQVVDALMIMVNNEVITVNEVIHPARARLGAIPAGIGEETFKEKARPILALEVRRQIGQTLVLKEADKFLDDDEKKQVDTDLQEHLRDRIVLIGGSKRRLEEELQKQGTTLEEAMNVQRRELISRLYMRKKFFPQMVTTRDKLWKYYQNHPEEFSTPKKVQMQVLELSYKDFLPVGMDEPTPAELAVAKDKAHAKAQDALTRIKAGEDFGAVVDEVCKGSHEPGGVWEFMPAGSFLEKNVEDAAFSQAVGQVSGVIEGRRGVLIVKTKAVQAGKVTSFEEAQDEIDNKLRDQQYDDLTAQYFTKLASKAQIVQAEQFEKNILDRAVQLYYRRTPQNLVSQVPEPQD